ncbi:MAG TPA: hypothetical protein VF075_14560 [Pyrinomonadaceae bacterium]
MQTRIRIIKRSEGCNTNKLPVEETAKTDSQRERDTASTVKTWIAEWEARNRLLQAAAFSLVRSLENSSESATQQLAVAKV